MDVIQDAIFPSVVAVGSIRNVFAVRKGVDILYGIVIHLYSVKQFYWYITPVRGLKDVICRRRIHGKCIVVVLVHINLIFQIRRICRGFVFGYGSCIVSHFYLGGFARPFREAFRHRKHFHGGLISAIAVDAFPGNAV